MRGCKTGSLRCAALSLALLLTTLPLAAEDSMAGCFTITANPTDQTVVVGQAPSFTLGLRINSQLNGVPILMSEFKVEYWWFINRQFEPVPWGTAPTTQVPDYKTTTPTLTLPSAAMGDNGMEIVMGVGLFTGPSAVIPGAIVDGYISPSFHLTVIDSQLVATVSSSPLTVGEGLAPATYDLTLNTAPTAAVTVTLTAPGRLTMTPATVTFITANYSLPQSIAVTAVDDAVADPALQTVSIQHTLASGDGGFNGKTVAVTVGVVDNDPLRAVTAATGGTTAVTEGGTTDNFTVALDRQPSGNATVMVAAGAAAGLVLSPPALTFTPANWNTPQAVTVTAVDDAIANGVHEEPVQVTVQPGAAYTVGAATADVPVTVTDNDAGVAIQVPGGKLTLYEGGAAGSYQVVLSALGPTADVTVQLVGHPLVTLSTATLTFTPANWNLPQTVTVTAVDDTATGKLHWLTLGHTVTSTDPAYDGKATVAAVVVVVDNDKLKTGACTLGGGDGGAAAALAGLLAVALTAGAAARRGRRISA